MHFSVITSYTSIYPIPGSINIFPPFNSPYTPTRRWPGLSVPIYTLTGYGPRPTVLANCTLSRSPLMAVLSTHCALLHTYAESHSYVHKSRSNNSLCSSRISVQFSKPNGRFSVYAQTANGDNNNQPNNSTVSISDSPGAISTSSTRPKYVRIFFLRGCGISNFEEEMPNWKALFSHWVCRLVHRYG